MNHGLKITNEKCSKMVALSSKKIIVIIVCVVVALVVVFVAWAFLWPSRSAELQKADIKRRDYDQSVADIQKVIDGDTANGEVRPESRPILKTHGKKTARAVMILHGVSGEPSAMAELADWFYQAGYNVYVPRVPYHGLKNNKLHGQVRAGDLVKFMSDSAGLVSGLGDELGVIGHSGGGTLATWLVQYGDGLFSRVLLLSPYYEPDASKAPKWQVALLRNIYGNHLLPDRFFDGNLSYRALANYVIIKQNYHSDLKAEGLKHVGLITGSEDHLIDNAMAIDIAENMAKNSGAKFTYERTPAHMGVGHELIWPGNKAVKQYKKELYDMYVRVYER